MRRRYDIHEGMLILVNREHPYREPLDREQPDRGQLCREQLCKEQLCREQLCREQPHGEQPCGGQAGAGWTRREALDGRGLGGGGDLVPVREEAPHILLRRRAARLLEELMGSIGGWEGIVPVSGWRSGQEQQELWDSSLRDHGKAFTEQYVAAPGCSEHQTGLAIDLGRKQGNMDFIRPEFPYEGLCQKFRRAAARFGFVERYPRGKEAVTGIAHEPWHFRYVGVPHAASMGQEGLTLEEYVDYIRAYPWGRRTRDYEQGGLCVSVSYLPAADREGMDALAGREHPFAVSGNNVDGFIITEWRGVYADRQGLRRA